MKRIRKIIIGVLVVLLLIVVAGSFYMLNFSLRPSGNKGKDIEGSYEWMYAEYPFLKPWVDSLTQVHALRDTFMMDDKGVRLHALYAMASQPTRRTAVIVHGYTDCAVRMLMIGYLYHHDLGYNILLPDLYDCGESGGDHIRMGWLDRFDVMQWMDVANHLCGDSARIVVHGISMGAATTMMVSGEPQPDYVCCYVEDCGYTSVWDEFSKELDAGFGLPEMPLLYATSMLCRLRYGWDFKEASSLNQVAKSTHPMLFIHGDVDDYVPTWMVYKLYDAKQIGEKELWIVPGAPHAASYLQNREAYTEKVKTFVGRYM